MFGSQVAKQEVSTNATSSRQADRARYAADSPRERALPSTSFNSNSDASSASTLESGLRRSRTAARSADVLRRGVDIVVSLLALIVGAPVLALLVLIIRIDSPGPALYWQIRMTRRGKRVTDPSILRVLEAQGVSENELAGRPFRFVKFRTMYIDAAKRFPEYYRYEHSQGLIQDVKVSLKSNDPRLTRAGEWLRKTSLDELPNFWCVLKGDMTLIGPRPELPQMSVHYRGAQRRKFDVKAGVSGLAQVGGRGLLTFSETLDLDLNYVDSRTLWGDALIVLKTVRAVLQRTGAW